MSIKTMTPEQSKESLDELRELQLEQADLARALAKATDKHKEAKGALELKENEILDHLARLNEELPLFESPNDVPWPFPLPEGTHQASLGDVACDSTVLGITVGIVKAARSLIGGYTLGALEKFLNAASPLKIEEVTKRKTELGKKLGANQATMLLRGVHSFTTGRKAKSGKGPEPKPVDLPATDKPAAIVAPGQSWRETKVADLPDIGPKAAQMLAQVKLATVGALLDRLDKTMMEAPSNPPPTYQAASLASYVGMLPDDAKKVIAAAMKFDEEQTLKNPPPAEPAKAKPATKKPAPKKGK